MQGVMRAAILRSTGHLLLAEFLPDTIRAASPGKADEGDTGLDVEVMIESLLQEGATDLHAQVVRTVERVLLARVLRHTQGHQAQASDLLGLHRSTLRTKLRELGLSVERVVSDPPSDEKASG